MPHALDPLSAQDLDGAVEALRRAGVLDDGRRLVSLTLDESRKAEADWDLGSSSDNRQVLAIVFDPRTMVTSECTVALADGTVVVTRVLTDVQPSFVMGEYHGGIPAVRADPRVQAAMARRDVTDIEQLHVELWPFGGQVPEGLEGRRIAWAALWVRHDRHDNPYAHPVRGLEVIFDLARMEVVSVTDRELVPIPEADGRWVASEVGPHRPAPAPLEIVQPEGPGFDVDGWVVRWQGWSLRVGFNGREGLTLHTIAFDDGSGARRICYRASIAELVIPYADPHTTTYRKAAFDIGEIGLGHMTNSLELGCDCLGEIRYLDVAIVDDAGDVTTVRNAICMHEEDFGILWKHTDVDGHVEVRRSRRFVVSSIVTVDNYEYGFYWYLYQDGTIEFEGKMTGIVLTAALRPGEDSPYGVTVGEGVTAMLHQHFFCARLDLDIDGQANSVYEVHSDFEDLPAGAGVNAFVQRSRLLETEADDAGLIDPLNGRYWAIVNPHKRGHLGRPVGYKLVPGVNVRNFMRSETSMGRRVGFCDRHLWVTPFDGSQRYPAGDYPNLNDRVDGLPRWVEGRRSVIDRDVVVWYVFGAHHVPRQEDWPVMPVERLGFHLKPLGFFDRTPAITLPPRSHCAP